MPTLTIRSGLLQGQQFRFDKPTVVGRGATADLSFADPGVSRRHASFDRQDAAWSVSDLGSANGTKVNGRRLSAPVRLTSGDVLDIGTVVMAFDDDADVQSSAPAPEVQYREGNAAPAVLISLPGDVAPGDPAAAGMDEAVRLRFLADFAKIGTLVFDEPALVSFIADELLALVPRADRSIVFTHDRGELTPRATRTRSGKPPDVVASRRLLRDVMEKREAVLAIDTLTDERYSESESMVAAGIRAAICAPMMFHGEIYGVVQVDSASAGVPFKEADVALVLSLASQLGMALGYARLHATLVEREIVERDIALARRIQQQFLPVGDLELPGYSLGVVYRPALGVSGDFYDLIELDAGRVALVAGDVSGKGISAALYASKLTTDLRYQAMGQVDPGEILARTNRVLTGRDHEGMFATLAVIVIETGTGVVELANAGHPPPFVRRRDGRVVPIGRAGSAPLGLDANAVFPQTRCDLLAGESLLLYTDGVIEALNAKQELFDEPRTLEAIRTSDGTVDGILATLGRAIETFVGGAPQSDDVTIVCLRRA